MSRRRFEHRLQFDILEDRLALSTVSISSATLPSLPIVSVMDTTLSELSVTQWTKGAPGFSGTMNISLGTAPFSLVSFTGVPVGLTPIIDGSVVRFTGVPTVAGVFAGSVTVEDVANVQTTKSFTITINPALNITTQTLPTYAVGRLYITDLAASGGTGARTASVVGALPTGLYLNPLTGRLSGTINRKATFSITIRVVDEGGGSVQKTFTLTGTLPFNRRGL